MQRDTQEPLIKIKLLVSDSNPELCVKYLEEYKKSNNEYYQNYLLMGIMSSDNESLIKYMVTQYNAPWLRYQHQILVLSYALENEKTQQYTIQYLIEHWIEMRTYFDDSNLTSELIELLDSVSLTDDQIIQFLKLEPTDTKMKDICNSNSDATKWKHSLSINYFSYLRPEKNNCQ